MRYALMLLFTIAASGCSYSLERFPVVSVTTLTERLDSGGCTFGVGCGVLIGPHSLLLTRHQAQSTRTELCVNGEKIHSWQFIDLCAPGARVDLALVNLDHSPAAAHARLYAEVDESPVQPGEILHVVYVKNGGSLAETTDRVVELTEDSSPEWRKYLVTTNSSNLGPGTSGSGVFRRIRPGAKPALVGIVAKTIVAENGECVLLIARPTLQRSCRH